LKNNLNDLQRDIDRIRRHIQITEDIVALNWNMNHWPNVINDIKDIVDLIEKIIKGRLEDE
jgi:hypothetical protein